MTKIYSMGFISLAFIGLKADENLLEQLNTALEKSDVEEVKTGWKKLDHKIDSVDEKQRILESLMQRASWWVANTSRNQPVVADKLKLLASGSIAFPALLLAEATKMVWYGIKNNNIAYWLWNTFRNDSTDDGRESVKKDSLESYRINSHYVWLAGGGLLFDLGMLSLFFASQSFSTADTLQKRCKVGALLSAGLSASSLGMYYSLKGWSGSPIVISSYSRAQIIAAFFEDRLRELLTQENEIQGSSNV